MMTESIDQTDMPCCECHVGLKPHWTPETVLTQIGSQMKFVEPDDVLLRMYDHAIGERNKADARRAVAIDSLTAANSSHIEWSAEVNAIWDELCARDLVGGDR